MKDSVKNRKVAKALVATFFSVGFVTPLMFSNIAEAANFGVGGTTQWLTNAQIDTCSAKNSNCEVNWWTGKVESHNISDNNCVMINGHRFKVMKTETPSSGEYAGKQILTLWSYNSTETGAARSFGESRYNQIYWPKPAEEAYNKSELKPKIDGLLKYDSSGNPKGGKLYDSKLTYVKYTSTIDSNVTDAYVWAPSKTEVQSTEWGDLSPEQRCIGHYSWSRSPTTDIDSRACCIGIFGVITNDHVEGVCLLRPAMLILNQISYVFTANVVIPDNGVFTANAATGTATNYGLNSTESIVPTFTPTSGVTLDGTKIGITTTNSSDTDYKTAGLLTEEADNAKNDTWAHLNGEDATSEEGISYMAQVKDGTLDFSDIADGDKGKDYTLKIFGLKTVETAAVTELAANAMNGLSKGSDGKIHMKIGGTYNNGVAIKLKHDAVVDMVGDADNTITVYEVSDTGKLNLGASNYTHSGNITDNGTLTVEGTGTLAGTVSGMGKIIIAGNVSADVDKLTQTGGLEVKDSGDALTFTGTNMTLDKTVSGKGKIIIDGTISSNADNFTQTGGLEVKDSGDILTLTGGTLNKAVTNNGTVVLNGATMEVAYVTTGTLEFAKNKWINADLVAADTNIVDSGVTLTLLKSNVILPKTISGAGDVVIYANISASADQFAQTGTLEVKKDCVLTLTGGTLSKDIINNGTMKIAGASINGKHVTTGTLEFAADTTIVDAEYVAADTNQIDSGITLTLSGGTLSKDISIASGAKLAIEGGKTVTIAAQENFTDDTSEICLGDGSKVIYTKDTTFSQGKMTRSGTGTRPTVEFNADIILNGFKMATTTYTSIKTSGDHKTAAEYDALSEEEKVNYVATSEIDIQVDADKTVTFNSPISNSRGVGNVTMKNGSMLDMGSDGMATTLVVDGNFKAGEATGESAKIRIDISDENGSDNIIVTGDASGKLNVDYLNIQNEVMKTVTDPTFANPTTCLNTIDVLGTNNMDIGNYITAYGEYIYTFGQVNVQWDGTKINVTRSDETFPVLVGTVYTGNQGYNDVLAKAQAAGTGTSIKAQAITKSLGYRIDQIIQNKPRTGESFNPGTINQYSFSKDNYNFTNVGRKSTGEIDFNIAEEDKSQYEEVVDRNFGGDWGTLTRIEESTPRTFTVNGNDSNIYGSGYAGITVEKIEDTFNFNDVKTVDDFKDGIFITNKGTVRIGNGTGATPLYLNNSIVNASDTYKGTLEITSGKVILGSEASKYTWKAVEVVNPASADDYFIQIGDKYYNIEETGRTKIGDVKIKQRTLKINEGAELEAHISQLEVVDAITDNGILTFTGGTLNNSISGTGKVVIGGTVSAEVTKFTQTGGLEVASGQELKLTGSEKELSTAVSGSGKLVIDGTVETKVDNIGSTLQEVTVNSGEKLTLTGNGTLSKAIGGTGDLSFYGSIYTNADNISSTLGTVRITNSSSNLLLTGGTLRKTLNGTGNLLISGNVTTNANNIVGGIYGINVIVDADCTLNLNGGTLGTIDTSISNKGIVKTNGDVTINSSLSGGASGKLVVESGKLQYTNTTAGSIGNDVEIKAGAIMDPDAGVFDTGTTVTNYGTLEITGGTLTATIDGKGGDNLVLKDRMAIGTGGIVKQSNGSNITVAASLIEADKNDATKAMFTGIDDPGKLNVHAGKLTLTGKVQEGKYYVLVAGTAVSNGTLIAANLWSKSNISMEGMFNVEYAAVAAGESSIAIHVTNATTKEEANTSGLAAVQQGATSMGNEIASSMANNLGMMSRPSMSVGSKAQVRNVASTAKDDYKIETVETGKASEIMPVQVVEKGIYDKTVWASYIHTKERAEGMELGGGLKGDNTAQYNGTVIGIDFYSSKKAVAGIALSYVDGNISSYRGTTSTKNDAKYYGVSFYDRVTNGNTAFIYDIGYIRGDNDITQYDGSNEITADANTDSYTAGVRYEAMFETGRSRVVPFAAFRYMRINNKDYSNSHGTTFKTDDQNLYIPQIGITWKEDFAVPGSVWTWRPSVEVGYLWNLGDRKVDGNVLIGTSIANIAYDTVDKSSYYAKLGMEFMHKNFTAGVFYRYLKGDTVRNDKWNVNVSWGF